MEDVTHNSVTAAAKVAMTLRFIFCSVLGGSCLRAGLIDVRGTALDISFQTLIVAIYPAKSVARNTPT